MSSLTLLREKALSSSWLRSQKKSQFLIPPKLKLVANMGTGNNREILASSQTSAPHRDRAHPMTMTLKSSYPCILHMEMTLWM
jgi:hypothetical protein